MNELIEQINTLLAGPGDRGTLLPQVLTVVLKHFNSETGTIHLLDPAAQLLHLTAQVGLPPQMLGIVGVIPVGKGIAGQVVAQDKPVTICNIQTDKSGVAKPGAKQTGVGGALCVPMRHKGKIVGTLGIGTAREHEYTPDETKALEAVADLLGARVN